MHRLGQAVRHTQGQERIESSTRKDVRQWQTHLQTGEWRGGHTYWQTHPQTDSWHTQRLGQLYTCTHGDRHTQKTTHTARQSETCPQNRFPHEETSKHNERRGQAHWCREREKDRHTHRKTQFIKQNFYLYTRERHFMHRWMIGFLFCFSNHIIFRPFRTIFHTVFISRQFASSVFICFLVRRTEWFTPHNETWNEATNNGTDLLQLIRQKLVDAVVSDVTITSSKKDVVTFTIPLLTYR
jgi:hypothetical protein